MRNILTHDYGKVKLAHVWEVTQQDLPVLIDAIQRYLDQLGLHP